MQQRRVAFLGRTQPGAVFCGIDPRHDSHHPYSVSQTFEGDEWKHAKPHPETCPGPTSLHWFSRAERQRRVNDAYTKRKIDITRWRELTIMLSDTTGWRRFTDHEMLPL